MVDAQPTPQRGALRATPDAAVRTVPATPVGFLTTQVAQAPVGECPYVLLLGAGASISSGVPGVATLVDRWRRELFCHETGISPDDTNAFRIEAYRRWMDGDYPGWLDRLRTSLGTDSEYGTLFQFAHKTRDQRQMFVERLIENQRPGLGYFYLAGLIDGGRFNSVLTTNFDDLVNDALLRYYERKPIVCAFDSAVTSFSSSTLRPKIIKLHGDFLFDNIKNTDSETLDLGENMESKLVEICEDKGLIVVGYDGADESVMTPLRENLRRNRKFLTKGVHWCVYQRPGESGPGTVSESSVDDRVLAVRKRHPDRVFLYGANGFDELMLNFSLRCDIPLPIGIERPYARNLARDFVIACAGYEVENRMTDDMRRHRVTALGSLEQVPDTAEIHLMRADSLFGDAVTARRGGDHAAAARLCRECVIAVEPIVDAADAPENYWLALRRLVGCYAALGKAERHVGVEHFASHWERARERCRTEIGKARPGERKLEGYLSMMYNGLCCCGLLWALGQQGEEMRADIDRMLSAMAVSELGRRKLSKLATDPDVEDVVAAGLVSPYLS